ncbi:MAG: hypothetical protein ACREIU_00250 [Planctomycetota bacterium]
MSAASRLEALFRPVGGWRAAALLGLGVLWALEGQVWIALLCALVAVVVGRHGRREARAGTPRLT